MKPHINAILDHIRPQTEGISVGVKANIAVKDYICHGGIKAYETDIARDDAVVISRLKAAGYNIAAIANMEEGAPSHDKEMLKGVMPLSPTLDTVGVHGKSLEDVVRGTEVITARDFSVGIAGEITLLDYEGQVICKPDVQAVFENFTAKLGELPTTKLAPYGYGKSRRAGLILAEVEGYAVHADKLAKLPEQFSDFFRGMLEYGRDLPLEKVDTAYAHIKALRAADFPDFILMPTAPQTAFKFGDTVPANQADFTAFANLADRPAIQFPIGHNSQGLPIGAQLVGPRDREADLVATVKRLMNG